MRVKCKSSFRFRSKLGRDVAIEAMNLSFIRPADLVKHACLYHVQDVMMTYLETLA